MSEMTEIVDRMSADDLRNVLVGEDKNLVLEGGKMFPDATRIHQENVAATLKYIYETILPALEIDRKWVQPLGSTGKKLAGGTSGDIDLGIDATKCDFLEGITDTKDIVKALADHCKPIMDDMEIESRMIPTLYSIKCPIQNFDGKQEGEFVQLDMMATLHMKFQNWSLYSPSEVKGKKFFKGAVRNSIIEAVAHAMDKVKVLKTGLVKFKDGIREDMVEWEEYSYFIQEGLNMKKCVRQPMKVQPKGATETVYTTGSKDTRSLVTNDPDTIAKKMFGPKVKGKDLMDWESTWNAAKKAYWAKDNWNVFIDSLREKMVEKMKAGVEIPPEILDATGLEPIQADESTLACEGGNRFPNVTRINQKNAKPTMDEIRGKLKKFFGLKDDEIIFTGSTGKKLDSGSSGDVDCAISKSALKEKFGMETPEEWFDICRDFAKDADIEIDELPEYGFEGIAFAYPIVNADGKQEGQFVQLDLIPDDNLKFRDWSQYAPAEKEGEDYVKGLVRNQIISAAAKVSGYKVLDKGKVNKKDGEDNPTKWERYSYSHQIGGLYKKTFERPLMKGKKGEEGFHKGSEDKVGMELVTNDPDEICEILFGVDSQNMLTWEDAWKAVKKAGILKDPKKEKIFHDALKQGIEQAVKGGNLPYLPPMLEKYLDIDIKSLFGVAKKKKQERERQMAAESIKSTKGMSELDTPREAMTKIHQLTGKDLRFFLDAFARGVNNSSLLVKVTPKIDGYPFRVAWVDGKVCMEISYSGLLDKEGVEAITGKGVFPHERRFYDYVEQHQKDKMFKFLESIGLEGVKLVGELLANGDEFKDNNGTITYVGTTYDADKLGSCGSLVVIDVKGMTKEKAFAIDDDKKKKVVDFACATLSDASASYFDINQFAQEVEVSASDFPEDLMKALKDTPPEKMKREQAENLRDQINAAMTDLMKKKFKNPDIMKADDGSLEGVAFEMGGKLYGIHYQSWKDIRNGYFSEIDEMANFTKKFLCELTGMNDHMGFSKMVTMIRTNPEKYQAKYEELLPKFLDRAQELVKNAETRTDLPKFIDNISKSRASQMATKFDPSQLTMDVMSLVDFVGGKVTDKGGKTIALIPGSFKPPHKGHFDMVKHYAEMADEVVVAISGQTNMASQRKDKFGRTMPNFVAGEIMQIYCEAAGIQDKVSISMTLNPMNWVNSMLHHMSNCKVLLGLSSKDDPKRFDQFTNEKFLSTLQNVEILDVAKNAAPATQEGETNISATYVRDHIDDKEALRKVLPSELDDKQFEEVFKLMNPESGKYPAMNDPKLAAKFNQRQQTNESGNEANTVDEYYDMLSEVEGLDVRIVQVRKDYKVIQVNAQDPKQMRKELVLNIGPKLGIDFVVPRKTKKDGYTLEIPTYLDEEQEEEGRPVVVRIKKGGSFRPGKANEIGLQQFIRGEIESNGKCHLDITDNYGVNVTLDIVGVVDASEEHGRKGSANRSDTIVELEDGRLYGISQKQPDASIVCSAKKMFQKIMYQCGQALRQYAIEHEMERGQYIDVRITNRDLVELCWFGTDLTKSSERLAGGAVFIGDFKNMTSGEQTIERIIESGDEDFMTSFPIFTKWLIVNNKYTMEFKGVYCKNCKWIVDDVKVPGVNAPLPNGKSYYTGEEEPKKRRKGRKKKRVDEDGSDDAEVVKEARENDIWDVVAQCAENHKMLWLKYETVEDGEVISRKVAPYSYRTRNTKVRGRSTYFYADDFTPGEEHGIKCFLIENCLDVRESKQSFTPRFPVEIKQEIDRLEQKRREEEKEKEREEQKMKSDQKDRERKRDAGRKTVSDMENYKNTPEKPKPREKPDNGEGQNTGGNEQKNVDVVKTDVKPDRPNPKPEKEPPPPPEEKKKEQPLKPEKPEEEKNTTSPTDGNGDNEDEVTVTDEPDEQAKKPDTDEVQVTDDDGNVLDDEQH